MSVLLASGGIDWTMVIGYLIAGLPAIIAAIYAGRVHSKIRTPSGKPIGAQVEDVLHTALANNYHLRSIGESVNADASPGAQAAASRANDAPGGGGGEPGAL